MEEIVISMFAGAFLLALKRPELKFKIRGVALKIFRSIRLTYSNDPDFQ